MKKEAADIIELTLPARAEYIGVARLTVSGVANRMGFAYDEIEDIKVAVAEACTNAVRHAYPEGEAGAVYLQMLVHSDRLTVVVADRGSSFDLNGLAEKLVPIDPSRGVEELAAGGLGLFLIHSLMDQVEICADVGVVISMTKHLHRDGVACDAGQVQTEPGE